MFAMLRVLVVDDEAPVRQLLASVLGAEGVQLYEAHDHPSALEQIHTHELDVAIIDKNLPGGTGLDLIRTLKQRRPDAEAILITGYPSLESAIEAVEAGAYDYVLKPFDDLSAFRLKVRNAAEKVRLRRVEKQLMHGQKLEALGRLASGVAHDFNNLLCVMLNAATQAAEAVARGDVGAETRENLHAVLTAVDSATRLTRQLQAFSRRPTGTPEVLDVNEVVTDLATLLRRVVGEDRDLAVQLGGDLPSVKMPRTQLEQVLVNLVLNARDAIAPGGTVAVRTAGRPAGVELQVSERSGAGERVSSDLSIVLGIVQAAGGSMILSSDESGGASVRISLPACREARPPRAEPLGFPDSLGETVLIADDDEGMRSLLERTFTRAGYLVATARNAADATVKFQSLGGDVDLVVTDLVMPQMSGRDLVSRLKRVRPSLGVIYLSGYTSSELLAQGLAADDGPLLHKPFSPEELGRAVRRALGRR
jgi:CheY-like chemotaxis protein